MCFNGGCKQKDLQSPKPLLFLLPTSTSRTQIQGFTVTGLFFSAAGNKLTKLLQSLKLK
jgi:hypothetical protein